MERHMCTCGCMVMKEEEREEVQCTVRSTLERSNKYVIRANDG